jgi:hypothetical protein
MTLHIEHSLTVYTATLSCLVHVQRRIQSVFNADRLAFQLWWFDLISDVLAFHHRRRVPGGSILSWQFCV